jgi:uncharacterized protein with gpF-like domain
MQNNQVITIKPVRANMGIRDDYAKSLHQEIIKMNGDVRQQLLEAYKRLPEYVWKNNEGKQKKEKNRSYLALLLLPLLKILYDDWQSQFDNFARQKAASVVMSVKNHTDRSLANKLKNKEVRFNFTGTNIIDENAKFLIAENVNLIKSIPEKYLNSVQSIITEAVVNDKDETWIARRLTKEYGITRRRAKMIARDQITKINAAFVLARQKELGIEEAIWRHTNRAKVPRPKHVAASGEKYDVNKGMLIEGEYIYPGQKINCMCVSEWILPK